MLGREEAQRRLAEQRSPDFLGRLEARVKRLPRRLRPIARDLIGDRPQEAFWRSHSDPQALQRGYQRLDALPVRQRTTLFGALFPAFPQAVEAAWSGLVGAPYQQGHLRRAFRAPHDPALSLPARGSWLTWLLQITLPYEQELAWFAAWAPYLPGYAADALGRLFACAIDRGGAEGTNIYDILADSVTGRHEIGAMGRHATRGLLCASSPAGWELMERTLLAAQRQEGLRQVILETIDEAHPEAFRRMVKLLRDEKMTRFAATVRAVAVWFGFDLDSDRAREIDLLLDELLPLLGDPAARQAALAGPAATAYLALWASAFEDAPATVRFAAPLLRDSDPERRFVACHLLAQLKVPTARAALLPALRDPEAQVAVRAFDALSEGDAGDLELFEPLAAFVEGFPKQRKLAPLVWPWTERTVVRSHLANALVQRLGTRPATELVPYLRLMDSGGRGRVARALIAEVEQGAPVTGALRSTLLHLVADTSPYVRKQALAALEKVPLRADEAPELESLLTRKAGDLRRGAISLLLNQSDDDALASAERLLAGATPQRQAGLEMLRELVAADREEARARTLAERYRPEATTATEATLLVGIGGSGEVPTLEDGLGLFDPAARTPAAAARVQAARLVSPRIPGLLHSLDSLIHERRETPLSLSGWRGDREELLGNLHSLWQPYLWRDGRRVANHEPPPLADLWRSWWRERPPALRDDDGLELPRALAALWAPEEMPLWSHLEGMRETLFSEVPSDLRHGRLVLNLLGWLLEHDLDENTIDLLLDGAETTLALLPGDAFEQQRPLHPWMYRDPRNSPWFAWFALARSARRRPEAWTPEQSARLWRLLRSLDEAKSGAPRLRPSLEETLDAWQRGDANDHDLLDQLIGPRSERGHGVQTGFFDLRRLSGLKPDPLHGTPELQALIERVRARVLEVESTRGDLPSAAAEPALALRSISGAGHALALLKGLGRSKLVRGYSFDSVGKASVYSHLLRVSFPAESDTPASFAAEAKALKIGDKRLLELAMYAPQWAPHVEHALDWPGLEDAGYWLHAHTKDTSWTVDGQVREVWVAAISERTPLSPERLLDGAVDVAWFQRSRAALGEQRWRALYAAAKFASGGGGHKRAQLFADAIDGKIGSADLLPRIEDKRQQDALRALGLLPLPSDEQQRQDEILRRYQIVQRFLKGSRAFGAQRRASERLAADIALENLARSAGAADPQRLAWAMEAREIADLAAGPLRVEAGEVTVGLEIDDSGEALLEVRKKQRILKRVPPALRKLPEIAALIDRKKTIGEQRSRMRASLEEAMIRGSSYLPDELGELLRHPVLRPQLTALVLVTEHGALGTLHDGRTLIGHDGGEIALGATSVRVAHPVDLLAAGDWHLWQRDCFERERIQPFKQVFRELYPLTDSERSVARYSNRYEGHQVEPRQALALLGKRGWVSVPDEGMRRTFHHQDLSVRLAFQEGYFTPAEVEGLTLAEVVFSRRGSWEPLELDTVPPRLFSEVMRDLDLVVSVAHRGGVDPEASASTVEMRTALLRETLQLLRLDNVRLQGNHALIDGRLGSYSVHLGSALAHRQPGGMLSIVPVHSQRRGRLFLPFADDDPKTAELVSKVVMLAKDDEIRDPTVLEQLR